MRDGFLWCPHCANPHPLTAKFCPSTGRAVVATALRSSTDLENLRSGDVVEGKYEIIATIGRGGMGVVYEAKHLALGLVVALKFMKRTSSDSMLKRFEQEARLSASIGHPNICRTFDLGALADGAHFIVMERLRGETLGRLLKRRGKLSPDLIVHFFSQVVSALGAAHRLDVIHRDIKPANIFVEMVPNVEPIAKILDFGCAKPLKRNAKVSQSGVAVGTASYMSPEQIRVEDLDGRSDLFSCGATMYQCLTGRHPFPGPSPVEVQTQIIRALHIPLNSHDIPQGFAEIIHRALQRRREDRFANAAEMLAALRDVPVVRPSFVPERIIPSFADEPPSSGD